MVSTYEQKTQAIAILKSGRSYEEAANITGLTINEVMKAWRNRE